MSLLRIEHISKWFGQTQVLHDISFVFEPGRVNMIIGPSGCGKTVLLKCIVGLIIPEKGRVFFGDLDFLQAAPPQRRAVLQNLGMLFQSSALFDSMTVGENVAFPLRVFTQKSEKEIQDRVAYCLERVGLAGTQTKYPAELSGGMKRRVGLARAIALNPQYLFCDEPNSGLDPLTARRIDALIQELTEEFHTTTIVVTHDLKSVMDMGQKILFLYNGHAEWQGSKQEMLHSFDALPPNLQAFLQASGLTQ
ncbi:MAG: ATP-binding cassette domain-containing protein [Bacteroidia bacterium]|jgi:phospholipid/cholesterol/gamma-HCH transport system ATP-binding protein|nr:ATP-binding cassette domain-containing protein [Bacteroidia bacterium]GIV23249.1 MAG: phosphonate ABC transporter ATP-binding protein [Bacteroidia bacterium]